MFFQKIEWKNIFAYGEQVQVIEYSKEGELILLKGQSGAGKTAVLSLPALALYGKIEKVNKSSVANRINKNGWIRATITKGSHEYVIERKFTPNGLTVFKDGENIENYGTKDAQAYIDNEISDIPQTTFSNMVSISMKKFKSFLSMSPTDRKQIIDRVFNLEVVNCVFENIKKDMKDVGQSINSDNTTLFQLSQTIQNANCELMALQDKLKTQDTKDEIDENNKKIAELNEKMAQMQDAYKQASDQNAQLQAGLQQLNNARLQTQMQISQVDDKLNLYSQEKCPTCGTHFVGQKFDDLKEKLVMLKDQKTQYIAQIDEKLAEYTASQTNMLTYLQQISQAASEMQLQVNVLTNKNAMIQLQMQNNTEFTAVKNIIDKTQTQIDAINTGLVEKGQKMLDLQNLAVVYSLDGVKQKVINNYIPLLNDEIYKNLELLNFPYQLSFDCKFEPHLEDIGATVPVETLSDGEMTRVDLVVLCSLFKLLKRRYPDINILSIDELVSFLDTYNSQVLLKFLGEFAKSINLNIFVVSHVSIDTECFDKCIEVTRNENAFSQIRIEDLMK